MILPFTNGFYQSDSLPFSSQQCVNWYVNKAQAPALSEECLFRTPGIRQLATSGTEANRGAWVMNGVPYFVNGTTLYKLGSDLSTLTSVGTITGTAKVSMADNGDQLLILVPGSTGYVYTESTDTLVTISDNDFTANGNPQYVVFIDGYFVLTTDSKKFICSALNDGTSYDALDFGTAEANPDDAVAPVVFKNQLFIAGSETIEAFQNIGGSGFPFQRSGLYLAKGVKSPLSLAVSNDTFMWIGGGKNESPAIWMFANNTAQKVSTTAIDNLLQDLTVTQLNEISAWSYAEKGAYFVGFTLPSTTIVVDTITGKWHERKSRVTAGDRVDTVKHRVQTVVNAYNKILVGDAFDGRIGEYSTSILDEYGAAIIRTVTTQPFQNQMQDFFIPSLEMTVENGVGNSDAEDPQISLEISRNGGRNYGPKRSRSIGKVGKYHQRAIWRRNGRVTQSAILKFTVSDPVDTALLQLTGEFV